jgi:hypothetical protein
MAATASDAVMLELVAEGWEWVKSERFHKKEAAKAKEREKNNPMKECGRIVTLGDAKLYYAMRLCTHAVTSSALQHGRLQLSQQSLSR